MSGGHLNGAARRRAPAGCEGESLAGIFPAERFPFRIGVEILGDGERFRFVQPLDWETDEIDALTLVFHARLVEQADFPGGQARHVGIAPETRHGSRAPRSSSRPRRNWSGR